MTEKEFLIGWLMEFGDREVPRPLLDNIWYASSTTCALSTVSAQYFIFGMGTVRVSQAGLDFIKEK